MLREERGMAFVVGAMRRGCGGCDRRSSRHGVGGKRMRGSAAYVKSPSLPLVTRVLMSSVGFVRDLAQETRFSPTGEILGICDLAMMRWPPN